MLYQQKSDRDPNPYLNFLSKLPPEEEEPEGLISGTEFEMKLLEHFGNYIEVFYLNSTLNFGIPPVLVFQLEVCFKVDRLLTGITAQQKGTTARWYSNKTSLRLNGETSYFFILQ